MNSCFIRVFVLTLVVMLATSVGYAQEDIKIYGFFQSYASASVNSVYNRVGGSSDSASKTKNTNFLMQQANLLASKDLGGNFNAFVNLEFVNNYSSDKKWGFFNLQEIFVKYEYSDALKIKGGLFLPQFNNLYEIYNRMPILPYIVRPFIYETAFYPILPNLSDDYLPSRALAQVYGTIPVMEGVRFDYAVYTGSAESKFQYKEGGQNSGVDSPGWSSTELKTLGLRVGARSGTLKVGASATWDSNSPDTIKADGVLEALKPMGLGIDVVPLGNTPRQRLGIDLSYSIAGFTVSGEYLMVNHSIDASAKATLKKHGEAIKANVPAAALGFSEEKKTELVDYLTDESFYSKSFLYVSAQYDINDQLFAYAMYNTVQDKGAMVLSTPLVGFTGGAGYRPIDDVVVKAQYNVFKLDSEFFPFDVKTFYLGVSVAF